MSKIEDTKNLLQIAVISFFGFIVFKFVSAVKSNWDKLGERIDYKEDPKIQGYITASTNQINSFVDLIVKEVRKNYKLVEPLFTDRLEESRNKALVQKNLKPIYDEIFHRSEDTLKSLKDTEFQDIAELNTDKIFRTWKNILPISIWDKAYSVIFGLKSSIDDRESFITLRVTDKDKAKKYERGIAFLVTSGHRYYKFFVNLKDENSEDYGKVTPSDDGFSELMDLIEFAGLRIKL